MFDDVSCLFHLSTFWLKELGPNCFTFWEYFEVCLQEVNLAAMVLQQFRCTRKSCQIHWQSQVRNDYCCGRCRRGQGHSHTCRTRRIEHSPPRRSRSSMVIRRRRPLIGASPPAAPWGNKRYYYSSSSSSKDHRQQGKGTSSSSLQEDGHWQKGQGKSHINNEPVTRAIKREQQEPKAKSNPAYRVRKRKGQDDCQESTANSACKDKPVTRAIKEEQQEPSVTRAIQEKQREPSTRGIHEEAIVASKKLTKKQRLYICQEKQKREAEDNAATTDATTEAESSLRLPTENVSTETAVARRLLQQRRENVRKALMGDF